MNWLLVFVGSGLGGCLRFGLSELFKNRWPSLNFPAATFFSNVAACAVLGLALAFLNQKMIDEKMRLLLAVGLCGGFSTFSTFSAECLGMLEKGQFGAAFFYILSSVAACLVAIFLASKLV